MNLVEMTNEEYHKTEAVSKSTLDMIAVDLNRVEWSRKCPQDQDKIKTFDFGDAMHAVCLEPDRLKTEFITMPPFNLRTNAGKEEKAAFVAESEDKKILTSDEHKKLNFMFESVMAHPEARAIIEAEGLPESSWFWTDKETGLECKCRPDKLIVSRMADVKTTEDLKKFHYSVDDYRYHVQNAWYCDGLENCGIANPYMEFLVIQKMVEIGRYPVRLVRLPDEAIEYGRLLYRQNLRSYAEFLNHGKTGTDELEMSYRFMNNAMEAIEPEVYYGE